MSDFAHYSATDLFPWPTAPKAVFADRALEGHWLNKEERERLDTLLGAALVNSDVRQRLLRDRDLSLFRAFSLSEETQTWLCGIKVTSLTELAQAIAYHS